MAAVVIKDTHTHTPLRRDSGSKYEVAESATQTKPV